VITFRPGPSVSVTSAIVARSRTLSSVSTAMDFGRFGPRAGRGSNGLAPVPPLSQKPARACFQARSRRAGGGASRALPHRLSLAQVAPVKLLPHAPEEPVAAQPDQTHPMVRAPHIHALARG